MNKAHFPHYKAILNNIDLAYYLICKNIPVEIPENATVEELWDLHKKIAKLFKENLKHGNLGRKSEIDTSYLDLKVKISQKMLQECEFCENQCHIDRRSGELGYCGIPVISRVSSAFLHHGEEPPLVPSGTIFFSGCTFGCVFCQNWDISTIGKHHQPPLRNGYENEMKRSNGTAVDGKQLALFADMLARQGARNVNYVGGDPTPNLHTIIESMKHQTQNITQLWNSNFYNSISALDLIIDLMDFWLPDFKYGNNECAKKYSNINHYWEILTRNLKFLYEWGSREIIIRHLVMPGHFECCTKPILKWISKQIPGTVTNLMSQYHPEHRVTSLHYPEINRRVSHSEMIEAFSLAERLNIPYRFVS
ncbi:MAG: radical SAM protein [Candidatus Lokiarchaeota archaeon]|nr:radical SAM protein [Candidatus Lokiarchaeota archaeon]